MKNLLYLILFVACGKTEQNEIVSYKFRVHKNNLVMIIENNSDKNYIIQHPVLIISKPNNVRDNVNRLTEDVINEFDYDYNNFKLLNKNSIIYSTNKNCGIIFLKLKKYSKILLEYKISNSNELSPGIYSIIKFKSECDCNKNTIKLPNGYNFYAKNLSIQKKINLNF